MSPDIVAEQKKLEAADLVIFQVWWNINIMEVWGLGPQHRLCLQEAWDLIPRTACSPTYC